MNSEVSDWYPQTRDSERILYANIDSKIDGYAAKYSFLTNAYLTAVHAMCGAFVEGFDRTTANRATARQMTKWFDNIVDSKQKDEAIPAAPVFQAFAMPAGAMLGLEEQCRRFARLMKSQANYDKADGIDLMIEREKTDGLNVDDAMPELKISKNLNNSLDFEWKKSGFDMLELNWRREGEEMWQLADKSTEKVISFAPPLTTPGKPEKFEFRAVYLIKNRRVGKWSPVYTETIG